MYIIVHSGSSTYRTMGIPVPPSSTSDVTHTTMAPTTSEQKSSQIPIGVILSSAIVLGCNIFRSFYSILLLSDLIFIVLFFLLVAKAFRFITWSPLPRDSLLGQDTGTHVQAGDQSRRINDGNGMSAQTPPPPYDAFELQVRSTIT